MTLNLGVNIHMYIYIIICSPFLKFSLGIFVRRWVCFKFIRLPPDQCIMFYKVIQYVKSYTDIGVQGYLSAI